MDIENKMTMKKILLCGLAPGWEDYPKDYDGEVWGINMGAVLMERIDKLFLADPLSEKTSIKDGYYTAAYGEKRGQKIPITEDEYKNIIIAKNLPFISCHPYELPTYEAYPLKEIVNEFGVAYFANVISYALAYAIYRGAAEIEIWGVRQGLLTEYAFHKGSVEFWLGVALGRGIDIKIVGDSHLLNTISGKLYGYQKTLEELNLKVVN